MLASLDAYHVALPSGSHRGLPSRLCGFCLIAFLRFAAVAAAAACFAAASRSAGRLLPFWLAMPRHQRCTLGAGSLVIDVLPNTAGLQTGKLMCHHGSQSRLLLRGVWIGESRLANKQYYEEVGYGAAGGGYNEPGAQLKGCGISFATQGASQIASPDRQRRADDRTNMLPVTVRMLERNGRVSQRKWRQAPPLNQEIAHAASKSNGDGELHFHGSETSPGMLLLVANVKAVHAQQTNMAEFTVEDGTGELRARFFATDGEAQESWTASTEKAIQSFTVGSWVKLFGHFRSSPSPHFSVSILRPVKSADDVTHHLLEVAHSALKCAQQTGGLSADLTTPAPKLQSTEPWTPEKSTTPDAEPHMEVDAEGAKMPVPVSTQITVLEGVPLRSALMKILQAKAEQGDEVGYSAPEAGDYTCGRVKVSLHTMLGALLWCPVSGKKPWKPLVAVQEDEYQCARCKWTAKVLRATLGERKWPRTPSGAQTRRQRASEALQGCQWLASTADPSQM
eukprot:g23218.t1